MTDSTQSITVMEESERAGALAGARDLAQFAGMVGFSIAAKDATAWVTHFLNAAYYTKHAEQRDLEDLRLAFAILTSYWHHGDHEQLHADQVHEFHHSFRHGRHRGGSHYPRGRLDREQLQNGATQLLGEWFLDAYRDPARRGWGIAFPTEADRDAHRPEKRLRHAPLGPLSPPATAAAHQTWHGYEPVEVPSAERVAEALRATHRWQDFSSEIGRFTAVRRGSLEDQTFEIEVMAHTAPHVPMFTRGYVSVTRILDRTDAAELDRYIAEINDALAQYGHDESPAVPEHCTPVLVVELTTHKGHFMGNAISRLVLYTDGERSYLRDVGSWDPMPWYIRLPYRLQGEAAQHAFWGLGVPQQSMLHQIGLALG